MERVADPSVVPRDVKGIDNPPDNMLGWELRFFFARLTSKKEGNLVESDSSTEEAPGSSSSGHLTLLAKLEETAPPSVMAQLKEELEASRAEVARLQSMLQGDVVQPSIMAEYLRSYAYRRQVEFE
ncbi:hypothetical protein ACLOJK_014979 [Asimina triloba]